MPPKKVAEPEVIEPEVIDPVVIEPVVTVHPQPYSAGGYALHVYLTSKTSVVSDFKRALTDCGAAWLPDWRSTIAYQGE